MPTAYEQLLADLPKAPRTWLITGVAGFIGSNLLETLLKLDQRVVGLDNFATGHQRNLDEVQSLVTHEQWSRFNFIEGDIRQLADCKQACQGVDHVLHQAALGSVPRSLEDPIATNASNIDGFLNMLVAARDAQVQSFTYAASSSTYGDHPALPKVEENIGKPLSPYAVTKYVNELYADVFSRCYGFHTIGLRYFNVFGPRQDPNGAYAAVIPKWTAALLKGEPVFINGDGETSRDFCFVDNAVQANLLAATVLDRHSADGSRHSREKPAPGESGGGNPPAPVIPANAGIHASQSPHPALNQIYNVAVGDRTTLNDLFRLLRDNLAPHGVPANTQAHFRDFRAGDVRHSQADVGKAQRLLGYEPSHRLADGVGVAMPWYVTKEKR